MAGRAFNSGCSCPGCHDHTIVGDLNLTVRQRGATGKYVAGSRLQVDKLFLCKKHWDQMHDFIKAYKADEEDQWH